MKPNQGSFDPSRYNQRDGSEGTDDPSAYPPSYEEASSAFPLLTSERQHTPLPYPSSSSSSSPQYGSFHSAAIAVPYAILIAMPAKLYSSSIHTNRASRRGCCFWTLLIILMLMATSKILRGFEIDWNGWIFECPITMVKWPGSTIYEFDARQFDSLNLGVSGAVTGGRVKILLSEAVEYGTLEVVVHASAQSLFKKVYPHLETTSTFSYSLELPATIGSECLRVEYTLKLPLLWQTAQDLTVHVHNMKIEIDDELSGIVFEKVELWTTNAPIKTGRIYSNVAELRTSNAGVSGEVSAVDAFATETSDSGNLVDSLIGTLSKVTLVSTNGHITGSYSANVVSATTSNGNIWLESAKADQISLRTSNGAITGSWFTVSRLFEAVTTNHQIDVRLGFPETTTAPTSFHALATSTNGRVTLQVPLTYNGWFDIETTHGKAKVQNENSNELPDDLHFNHQEESSKTGYKGSWMSQWLNNVKIRSSNSYVMLLFYDQ